MTHIVHVARTMVDAYMHNIIHTFIAREESCLADRPPDVHKAAAARRVRQSYCVLSLF